MGGCNPANAIAILGTVGDIGVSDDARVGSEGHSKLVAQVQMSHFGSLQCDPGARQPPTFWKRRSEETLS